MILPGAIISLGILILFILYARLVRDLRRAAEARADDRPPACAPRRRALPGAGRLIISRPAPRQFPHRRAATRGARAVEGDRRCRPSTFASTTSRPASGSVYTGLVRLSSRSSAARSSAALGPNLMVIYAIVGLSILAQVLSIVGQFRCFDVPEKVKVTAATICASAAASRPLSVALIDRSSVAGDRAALAWPGRSARSSRLAGSVPASSSSSAGSPTSSPTAGRSASPARSSWPPRSLTAAAVVVVPPAVRGPRPRRARAGGGRDILVIAPLGLRAHRLRPGHLRRRGASLDGLGRRIVRAIAGRSLE